MSIAPFSEADVLPTPNFEGSEKRVELDFTWSSLAAAAATPAAARGLRALPREHLDELMTLAACCIVSSRSNDCLDAYVLSESSLFVYPTKWVLKTCGTTKLLDAIPRLLVLAAGINMQPVRCKYTRASFLFPEQQPFPYTGFEHEVALLQSHFGSLGTEGGRAYQLGEASAGLQWHVYLSEADSLSATADITAATATAAGAVAPTFNLELCMTELAPECAAQFVRSDAFISAKQTTADSGIGAIKPSALIDDYVFEPCGYSMNGIDGSGLMTIHITPEEGQSYASLEVSGSATDLLRPSDLLAAAVKIFRPGKVAIALSVSNLDNATATDNAVVAEWGVLDGLPGGYSCCGATMQKHGAGRVTFYTLGEGEVKSPPTPGSPTSALNLHGSFLSVGASDSDDNNSCGDA